MRVQLLISTLLIGGAVAFAAAPTLAQQKKHDHGGADHKHNHPTAQHGGILEDVGEFHVEFVAKDGTITDRKSVV